MTIEKKLLGTSPSGDKPNVADVFSTHLYNGNGTSQTIDNGIDLDGEGGMVWIKNRDAFGNNSIFGTGLSGSNYALRTNLDNAELHFDGPATNGVVLNSNGFSLVNTGNGDWNDVSGQGYVSWTFRKAPKFFDIVTYTGNSVYGREIPHGLNGPVGMIFVKSLNFGGVPYDWDVYHQSLGGIKRLRLNVAGEAQDNDGFWGDTDATSTHFTVGDAATTNSSGKTYVAYLFADNTAEDADDQMIKCGSFTGTGSGFVDVNLGWEPQYLLVKNASIGGSDSIQNAWNIFDSQRGWTADGTVTLLRANLTNPESGGGTVKLTSTGFSAGGNWNPRSGETYVYMAIRAPMMVEPESGTEVFAVDSRGSTGDGKAPGYRSGFPVDMAFHKVITSSVNPFTLGSRLIQGKGLVTSSTAEEFTESDQQYDYMNGWNTEVGVSSSKYSWMFKRAKSFMDCVAFTAAAGTQAHSLGVAPELVIIKHRAIVDGWYVFSDHNGFGELNTDTAWVGLGNGNGLGSNLANVSATTFSRFSVFSVGTYIAYLFATLAGVSKVGSYTGNGTSQTLNCGFAAGARFILIKRTDDDGDWYVWDTARGIVAGNDPHLSLNTTAAEVSDDSIDPDNSGFIVNQVAATNINVSTGTYLFYAIA